jgi:hypothetical protein
MTKGVVVMKAAVIARPQQDQKIGESERAQQTHVHGMNTAVFDGGFRFYNGSLFDELSGDDEGFTSIVRRNPVTTLSHHMGQHSAGRRRLIMERHEWRPEAQPAEQSGGDDMGAMSCA